MVHQLVRQTFLKMGKERICSRRDLLRGISASGLAAGALSWQDRVAAGAAALRAEGKACILLWMQGGPSQFETFDPKPGHANGGETKAISTSVPGIQISENLPQLAKVMKHLAVVRSMSSKEGSHPRATFLLHSGNLPNPSVQYPALGSLAAAEIGNKKCELPAYVHIGGGRQVGSIGGGYLGREFDPFKQPSADQLPANTSPTTSNARYNRRLTLLEQLETDYAAGAGGSDVIDHQKVYETAARMIQSPRMTAFDLTKESDKMRDAYGRTPFGSGCLLARRLLETGVTFVEVALDGWDTHFDNFAKHKELTGKVDGPAAQLILDLQQRGMLDKTLVIWMGEFGRTPLINPRGGRDHFPKAFNLALAGGGIRGEQVIGSTDASGSEVAQRPVTVPDLFRTLSTVLGIDPDRERETPGGRPVKNVDGGELVKELLG
jgi:uncharacterized protein (DUF1501 family)